MDAQFTVDGQSLIIEGGRKLQGARVQSSDLRASASLIIAGLVADGVTKVTNLNHLDRGYYKFHEKLQQLGASIERIDEEIQVDQEASLKKGK